MAIVSFTNYRKSQTKAMMISVIKYCVQDKKTVENNRKFVTGVNCTADSVVSDFMNTKLLYHKEDGKLFFHLIQAFEKGEEVKPEIAHEMAIKLAEYFKDYEVLVSTHFDRDYTHSHLIINSVNFETGKKFHFLEKDLIPLRAFNDQLCREYGHRVCTPNLEEVSLKGMKSSEYHTALQGQSWKFQLINQIDHCMRYTKTKQEFIQKMQSKGYAVKWTNDRKSITYTCPNSMKCRDNKLHQKRYLKTRMEREFELRQQRFERLERNEQATDLQLVSAEYRQSVLQSGDHDRCLERDAEQPRLDQLQDKPARKPTPILSGAEGLAEQAFRSGAEFETGWEAEREELFEFEKCDRDYATQFHAADGIDHLSAHQTSARTLTNNLLWSMHRLEQAEDDNDELAELFAMAELTALSIEGVAQLIMWLKEQPESQLTDDAINNYVDELKQDDQNISYEQQENLAQQSMQYE